jgi:small subunit ribosomal protein S9
MSQASSPVWTTGRRKTAIARVRLLAATGDAAGTMTVNGRPWDEFFLTRDTRLAVWQPIKAAGADGKYQVISTVTGGGPQGQADALRHGLARALALADETTETALRAAGYLTRDARRKERKKYGQRGARARFQFSKR